MDTFFLMNNIVLVSADYSKVIQLYLHMYLFVFQFFCIKVITEYWAEFSVL